MQHATSLKELVPLRKNGALNTALLTDDVIKRLAAHAGVSIDNPALVCYNIVNDLVGIKSCSCGAPLKFRGFGKGYSASCGSPKCRQQSYEALMLERYGVTNSWQKDTTKRKIQETVRHRYGVEHISQSDSFKHQVKKTNKARYGVNWIFESPEKVKLRQDNNLRKYGVKEPVQLPEVQEKVKASNRERYGVDWCSQLVENRRLSNSTRYETENSKQPGRLLFSSREACERLYAATPNLALLSKKFNVGHTWLSRTFQKFGIPVAAAKVTVVQEEILELLKAHKIHPIVNDRKLIAPLEIDILVPGKLGIEIDGIYWHSYDEPETKEERYRHLNKLEKAEASGIPLMRITDVEWTNHKEIISSMILARLGIFSRRIPARKCKVQTVSKLEAKKFLEDNHLLGSCGFRDAVGLYHEDTLVALATFGKSRFLKAADTELLRFCCSRDIQVLGALGKILRHAKSLRMFKTLVSFSNRDKFSGDSYERLGFTLKTVSGPGYYYWHPQHGVVSRNNLQKHKLTKLAEYNPKLTESQICFNSGFRRYWNCGTKTWILQNEEHT